MFLNKGPFKLLLLLLQELGKGLLACRMMRVTSEEAYDTYWTKPFSNFKINTTTRQELSGVSSDIKRSRMM